MELVEGEDLAARIRRGPMPLDEALVEPRGTLVDPRISPDGRLAVAVRGPRGAIDLWIYDLERGSERRLTFSAMTDCESSRSRSDLDLIWL